jgi:hypothetical protein
MQDRSLSFPDFRRKRRQATPNLFTTLGVCVAAGLTTLRSQDMNGIIYLVGLVVVIGAVLSFVGLR